MSEIRKKRKVLGNSFLYTVSAVLSRAVSFVMMPIYTRFISTEQYGIVRVVNNFLMVAVFLVGMSLYSALVRFTTEYKNDPEAQKKLYGSVITFTGLMSLITLGLGYLLRDALNAVIFDGIPFMPYVLVGWITLVFRCQQQAYTSLLQGRQEGKKLMLVNVSSCFITVGINCALLFGLHLEGLSVLLSALAVDVLYTAYMFYDLKRRDLVTFGIDRPILKEALKYSVPLVPHQLSSNIATLASTVILKDKQSLSTVGLYNVASNFSVVIDTVQGAVNRAFMPWFFETMDAGKKEGDATAKKSIASFTSGMLVLYSLMYLCVGLFAQEFVLIFTSHDYALAWLPIPILVAGYSVKSVYYLYMDVLLYYKDPSKKLFIATVTGSLLNIVLSAYLAEPMGMYGVALSFLLSKIVVQTIVYFIARPYVGEVGYNMWKLSRVVLLSLAFMTAGLVFSYTRFPDALNGWNFLFKLGVLAAYVAVIYFADRKRADMLVTMVRGKLRGLRRKAKN